MYIRTRARCTLGWFICPVRIEYLVKQRLYYYYCCYYYIYRTTMYACNISQAY